MSRFVLDCAIRRPIDEVARGWHAAAQERAWASPTAGYHEGKVASALLNEAGAAVAELVDGASAQFVPDLPSGIDLAITAALSRPASRGVRSLLTSAVDALVMQERTAELARRFGLANTILDVDAHGRIDTSSLVAAPTPAVLITHAANQEIGVLQTDVNPWLAETGSQLILDATCAFGWAALPTGWSSLIVDPQAWGSPAGACAVVDASVRAPVTAFGNVPAAVVAGLTGQRWAAASERAAASAREQIYRIRSEALSRIPDIDVRGGLASDLPHVLSISALYVDGEALQTYLDTRGYAVGSGSACASRSGQPSHVLAAVGGLTSGNVRLGLPPDLPDSAVTGFIDALTAAVADVRGAIGAP